MSFIRVGKVLINPLYIVSIKQNVLGRECRTDYDDADKLFTIVGLADGTSCRILTGESTSLFFSLLNPVILG